MGGFPAGTGRRYVDLEWGQVHVTEAGQGPVLLLLHQTPRSADEFAELMTVLADRFRLVAPDLPGMGASDPCPGVASIEGYAAAVAGVLDAMGGGPVAVYGHHTGGVVAVELAASRPELVHRLVLSSTAWVDPASRERRRGGPSVDVVRTSADGSHLVELWEGRRPFYPVDRPDLLERFVADALRARDPAEGHRAVGAYRMEERIGAVVCPTLCIGASADPFAFPDLEPLASHIPGSVTAVVEGGTVALVEERYGELASLISGFVAD